MSGIALVGLSKRFGPSAPALRGVSLSVGSGEFVALVGPSGCGKTTLMRVVAGIESPDEGGVAIAGRDVTRLRPAERDVAMVFQSYALYPHLSVRENIAVPLAMRRLPAAGRLPLLGRLFRATRAGIEADVRAAAEALGLLPLLDRRPAQLSGGQRQRVALARAVVRSPRAFLMDEPLSNLDAELRVRMRREIVEIHRRCGAATLYVTHDQAEALTMADRVAVMMDGEILQVATPEAVYAEPADLRVARFIGSPRINTLAAEADGDGLVRVAGVPAGLRAPGVAGPLTLGLRPEDLRPGPDGLPATVEHLEYLGEGLLLHARHEPDGAPLVARLSKEERQGLAVGQRVRLRFPPAHALLFGPDGRRVPVRAAADAAALAA